MPPYIPLHYGLYKVVFYMKNSIISIRWSEICLVGSICLFMAGSNNWLAGTFLGLSMLGVFCRYAIEQQEQKAKSEAITSTIKEISEALKPGLKSGDHGDSLSDVYSKLFNFGSDINKKTSH